MAFDLANHRKSRSGRPLWSGSAFIVEALLLLVFLMIALALFTQMFSLAARQSAESDELSRAVAAASNVAERFAADPSSVQELTTSDGLVVSCDITDEVHGEGTLYHANISVYELDGSDGSSTPEGEPIYTISTAHYESGVNR